MYRFPTPADAKEQFHEWVQSASSTTEIPKEPGPQDTIEKAVLRIAGFPSTGDENFVILSKENDSKTVYAIWSSSFGTRPAI